MSNHEVHTNVKLQAKITCCVRRVVYGVTLSYARDDADERSIMTSE